MEETLDIWFMNVGHGDCTIIRHPNGRLTVVDFSCSTELSREDEAELRWQEAQAHLARLMAARGGHFLGQLAARTMRVGDLKKRLDDPVRLLRELLQRSRFHRLIVTHPEMDHIGGLRALGRDDALLPATLWDTEHARQLLNFRSAADEESWWTYQRLRRSLLRPNVIRPCRGQEGTWTQEGIEILSPTKAQVREASSRGDWNGLSYVLRITHGNASVILPGDATQAVLTNIARNHSGPLTSSILKAPHHGRESGFCEEFVERVSPKYTIVSVGKKPSTDASSKYRYRSRAVFSTRFEGTIHARLFRNGRVELRNREHARLDDHIAADALQELLGLARRSG